MVDCLFRSDWYGIPEKKDEHVVKIVLSRFRAVLTCTILLSDNGLDDETPESDAQDFTEADRTILGAVSSGDGDVAGIFMLVGFVNAECEVAVANR